MNSLIEGDVIDALYAASQAGVRINRGQSGGICGLRPASRAVGKYPRQVHRRAIPGTFRIVCFGKARLPSKKRRGLHLSSADWMGRNLSRRVETLVECPERHSENQITSQIMAANMAR